MRVSILLAYIAAVLTAILALNLAHHESPPIIIATGETTVEQSSDFEMPLETEAPELTTVSYKGSVAAKFDLKPYQMKNFLLASKVGKDHSKERLMMALLWRETRAGKFGPVGDLKNAFGKRSYGLWQMKVATAKDVLKRYPEIWGDQKKWRSEEEIIARLITDNDFAARMALGNIRRLEAKGVPYKRIPLAWNEGYSGSQGLDYDDHAFTMDVLETVQSPMIRELASL
jgi:hypothetical protein